MIKLSQYKVISCQRIVVDSKYFCCCRCFCFGAAEQIYNFYDFFLHSKCTSTAISVLALTKKNHCKFILMIIWYMQRFPCSGMCRKLTLRTTSPVIVPKFYQTKFSRWNCMKFYSKRTFDHLPLGGLAATWHSKYDWMSPPKETWLLS